jgi:ribonuclease P protein component
MAARFTRSEIKLFLEHAKRVLRVPGFDFLCFPASQRPGRLLIITPRRIGSAPERNTIRRRLKETFRTQSLATYGYDIGVIVKIQGVGTSSCHVHDYLIKALSRAQRFFSPKKTPDEASSQHS